MTEGFSVVPNWVIRDTDLDAYELLVLVALLNRADHAGRCWPGIKLIAKEARCSERKVGQALDSLEKRGLVNRIPQYKDDGSRTANQYVVQPFTPRTADTTPLHAVHHPPAHGAYKEDTREEDTREVTPIVPKPSADQGLEDMLDGLFSRAWSGWPNKKSKQPARKSFGKALRSPSWLGRPRTDLVEVILRFGGAYSSWPEPERRFVPMLSTWLNQERWTDPLPESRGQGKFQQVQSLRDQFREEDEGEEGSGGRLAIGGR